MLTTPVTIATALVLTAGLIAPGDARAQRGRATEEALIGARFLHYALRCHPDQRCEIECFQGGRSVVARARIEPSDKVTLVLTDGFSASLQPLWIEIRPADGQNVRTVLLPRDALCDLQGLTVQPLGQ